MSVVAFLSGSRLDRISSQRFFNRTRDGASIPLLSCALPLLLSLGRRTASRNTVGAIKYEEMFHNPHERPKSHLRRRFCGGGGAFDFLPERCSALELSSGIVGAEDRYLWGVVWLKFGLCINKIFCHIL